MGRQPKVRIDESEEEFCECNHMKILHTDTFQENHGCCIIKNCKCKKFTWAGIGDQLEIKKEFRHPDEIREEWKRIDQAVKAVIEG